MSSTIISVEGLGKRYSLRHLRDQRYVALRDVLVEKATGLFRRNVKTKDRQTGARAQTKEDFWALRDVSFEVKEGEVIGIIGRNGAGKSTLLKILSRITDPTEGRIKIKGRVASLLEVGTGFHPELTGRENIFLNGAILGMHRSEIRKKFDEIVAFAEIEKFLDTPVKRYSSGMYVRLAFAVAAHLEPEILIVDEVLAVGDAEFQKKCLGKMGEVAKGGRTIIFVSHDMRNITRLCDKGLLLESGKIECQGEMNFVVGRYLQEEIPESGYTALSNYPDRTGSGDALFESVELLTGTTRCSVIAFGSPLTVRTTVNVRNRIGRAHLAIALLTSDGMPVHTLENANEGMIWSSDIGRYVFDVHVPELCLFPGRYVVDLWIGNGERARVDYVRSVIAFQVVQTPESGPVLPLQRADGVVFARSEWRYELL
jgi:lipopolysaccharide transport system ATP-binding protein